MFIIIITGIGYDVLSLIEGSLLMNRNRKRRSRSHRFGAFARACIKYTMYTNDTPKICQIVFAVYAGICNFCGVTFCINCSLTNNTQMNGA